MFLGKSVEWQRGTSATSSCESGPLGQEGELCREVRQVAQQVALVSLGRHESPHQRTGKEDYRQGKVWGGGEQRLKPYMPPEVLLPLTWLQAEKFL